MLIAFPSLVTEEDTLVAIMVARRVLYLGADGVLGVVMVLEGGVLGLSLLSFVALLVGGSGFLEIAIVEIVVDFVVRLAFVMVEGALILVHRVRGFASAFTFFAAGFVIRFSFLVVTGAFVVVVAFERRVRLLVSTGDSSSS